jgi:hypothetical protein
MSITNHELVFNKGWVRENPDLALKFVHKFHSDYSEKYRISINEQKHYITFSADVRAIENFVVQEVHLVNYEYYVDEQQKKDSN